MKRYGQHCPSARALDVVGDRWTLLVVRELLLGPRRYRDLQDGLPGIGTNVLAVRLRHLQDSGIVVKRELPPPTAATVYDLTDAGRALRPILTALRTWGVEHAPPAAPADVVRPAWLLLGINGASRTLRAGKVAELRADGDVFHVRSVDGHLSVASGAAEQPDATITLDTLTLAALLGGGADPREVGRAAQVEGDDAFAAELLGALAP